MANIYAKVDEMVFDGLVTDIKPSLLVAGGVIEKLSEEATIKRGTILGKKANGKLAVLGSDYDATKSFSATGDGSKKIFNLAGAGVMPVAVSSVKVSGTATTAYTFNKANGDVVFDTAPANDAAIAITYAIGGGNANCILCDDVTVGTTSDEKVIVYTGGCFDIAKCTVATGYTVTDADKDDLRALGIVFKSAETK